MDKSAKPELAYKVAKNTEGPAYMVELRRVTGDAWAFPYTLLSGILFNPSGELRLAISDFQVTIKGRNLRPLFDQLQLHRATMIREMDEAHDPPEGETDAVTVVTKILVEQPENDPDNPPPPFLLPEGARPL